MNIVEKKLDKITKFWNHYVWNYEIIQKRVLWNNEVKTNYYGDILAYFSDTFELLKPNIRQNDFKQNIFHATGLMQIIYVQQDLTDELLRIFKQPVSSRKDKNPNRQIRNELVGHPISRDRNKTLKSSIFWGTELSEKTLHYIKYSKKSGFSGESISYQINDILESHNDFLNNQFDKILTQIKKILKSYLKKIQGLESMLDKNVDFINIVKLTSQIHEYFFEQNYLYKYEYLIECKRRENEHKRYKNVIDTFLSELERSIVETKSDIDEFFSDVKEDLNQQKEFVAPKFKIVFSESGNADIDLSTKRTNYSYIIQKLYSRKPVLGIDFLKEEFTNDKLIIMELDNMDNNYDNDLEYFSSCDYLRHLLK